MGLKLPPLVKYEEFTSDEEFLDALYEYLKQDFVLSKPIYKDSRIRLKRFPLRNNREATFYHITTTGKDEDNNGKKACGASYFSVNCEWLENKILDEIMQNFSDKTIEKTYKDFIKQYKLDDSKKSHLNNIKKEIDNKKLAQSNLIQSLSIISAKSPSAINAITQELEKISRELEELQAELEKQCKNNVIKMPM